MIFCHFTFQQWISLPPLIPVLSTNSPLPLSTIHSSSISIQGRAGLPWILTKHSISSCSESAKEITFALTVGSSTKPQCYTTVMPRLLKRRRKDYRSREVKDIKRKLKDSINLNSSEITEPEPTTRSLSELA